VLPDGVRVVDFGIRGLDLTYALLDGYEAVVLVDAAPRGGAPGTLYVLEPDDADAAPDAPGLLIEPHGLDPAKVLRLARSLGAGVRRVLLVGCEPAPPQEDEEPAMGLSDPVRAAVEEAVALVESLARRLLEDPQFPQTEVSPCRLTPWNP
jgi:hydrogenase maturation protease